jgi:Protein of unknown function (DUF664)
MDRAQEPGNAGERDLLLGWLAFHRDALAAKCDGLTPDQLVRTSAPPSDLSLLGLVRHLTEMEHVHLVYALGGPWPAGRTNVPALTSCSLRRTRSRPPRQETVSQCAGT